MVLFSQGGAGRFDIGLPGTRSGRDRGLPHLRLETISGRIPPSRQPLHGDKRLSHLPHHTGHGPFRTRPLTSVKSKRLRNKRENGIDCAAGRDYNSLIRQHKPSLSAEAEFYFFIKTLIIPGRYFCPQGAELFRYFFSEFYEV